MPNRKTIAREAQGTTHGRERWCLLALLILHTMLGIYWSVVIPLWEAHDEDAHYYYVRFVATEHRLPRPDERSPSRNDESRQPPLYYILAALPVSLVDVDEELSLTYNPFISWPDGQAGYNRFIHDSAAEAWPYRGTALAVHVARLVSVLLGALGILFTYLAGRDLAPDRPWVRWGAALTLALWPQYRFATAVVNNDLMVTVCGAALTWLLVRTVMAPSPLSVLGLGLAGGLAVLAKANGLALAPVAVLGILLAPWLASRKRRLPVLAVTLLAIAVGLAVVGWWVAHNLHVGAGVYGGNRTMAWLQDRLQRGLLGIRQGWDVIAAQLGSGFFSLWAGFGWNNLGLWLPLYQVAAAWAALGGIGLLWAVARRLRRRQILTLGLLLLAAVAVIVLALLRMLGSRLLILGRYLLPALPAVALGLGLGWSTLLPARARRLGWALMAGALALLAVVTPVLRIAPAYAPPPALSEADLAGYTPLHVTYGDFAELVGYRLDEIDVDAEGALHLTLAWRVLAQTDSDLAIAAQVYAGEREQVGEVRRFPGRGALGTTSWQPGALFTDEYEIPIHSTAVEGRAAWVEVSFFDPADLGRTFAAHNADGQGLGTAVRLGGLKMRGTAPALTAMPAGAYRFGPSIRLLGADTDLRAAGGEMWADVVLGWARSSGTEGANGTEGTEGLGRILSSFSSVGSPSSFSSPLADYTVSLQLRDAANNVLAQQDSRPQGGSYPTSLWEPGEAVGESRTLFLPQDLAPGEYGLYVCMYDSATVQRLPVTAAEGERQPLDEVQVATVTVRRVDGANVWELREDEGLKGLRELKGVGEGVLESGSSAKADAIVAGLAAAERARAAGDAHGALDTLKRQVFSQESDSLPGLYLKLRAEEDLAAEVDPRLPAPTRDRLAYFDLGSVAVPQDRRLALYLGETMADLTDAGLWPHDLLLRTVAYQVWRYADREGTGAVLDVLAQRYPGDADLGFYTAEWHERRGELSEAEDGYREVLALDPTYAPAYLRLGALAEEAGQLGEAADWYTQYHELAPGDILGLQRLAAVLAQLGRPEAAGLQEALAQVTDDRSVVAQLLGVPADAVELGPNLATNGGYEDWWGDEPAWWRWWSWAGGRPRDWATVKGGREGLLAPDGSWAARIDELWLRSANDHAPAGFWYRKKGGDDPPALEVSPGEAYLVSVWYRTAPGTDPKARLWLTSQQDVLWPGDRWLPATGGEWRRLVVVGRNASGQVARLQPLIRAYAPGSVQFEGFEVREIGLASGVASAADQSQLAVLDATGVGVPEH